MLSVILVNYNEREYVAATLRRLDAEFSGSDIETIVVDNASTDGSVDMLHQQFPNVRCIATGKNLMYGKGNNEGLLVAQGDWLMIINPDVDWKEGELWSFVAKARTYPGISVPRLAYRDGRTQVSAHRRFPTLGTVFIDYCLPVQQVFLRAPWHPYLLSVAEHHRSQLIAHATGVCLLFPRSVYQRIGGFDPLFTMYLEETEWEKRAAVAGVERRLIAESEITHFGSAAKTFAQESRHYLWGLQLYTRKHWDAWSRFWLHPVLWLGAITSILCLVLAYLPSLIIGRISRVQHYLTSYTRLLVNLVHFPKQPPTVT